MIVTQDIIELFAEARSAIIKAEEYVRHAAAIEESKREVADKLNKDLEAAKYRAENYANDLNERLQRERDEVKRLEDRLSRVEEDRKLVQEKLYKERAEHRRELAMRPAESGDGDGVDEVDAEGQGAQQYQWDHGSFPDDLGAPEVQSKDGSPSQEAHREDADIATALATIEAAAQRETGRDDRERSRSAFRRRGAPPELRKRTDVERPSVRLDSNPRYQSSGESRARSRRPASRDASRGSRDRVNSGSRASSAGDSHSRRWAAGQEQEPRDDQRVEGRQEGQGQESHWRREEHQVCFAFIAGRCTEGQYCTKQHVDEPEVLKAKLGKTRCRRGNKCTVKDCIFKHPK